MLVRAFRFMLYIWMRIFHGLQFSGTSNIPKEGPVIIAGNHPSFFDPVVLSLATTRHVRFFALADILKVPIVGWFARQWGILPVYRGGDNEPTVQKALRVLQRGGAIGIFPEGRRSLQYAMGTARPGVGRLAVQSGATIVPCVIYGTWKAWPHLTALPHPAVVRRIPLLHLPIRFLEEVKCSRGNMAKGSWRASTTWLRVSRSLTLLSPRSPITSTAGTIARTRVMSRRNHGLSRQRMKPSITTWPASVPVMVLLWPLASNATTNNVLATVVPSSGASVKYAIRIQSLFALKWTTSPPAAVTLVFP
jgi:1-acyl-sn-glycerol-3-phosphate acyltransferase